MSESPDADHTAIHIMPVGDAVAHEGRGCACGPTVQEVFREGFGFGWQAIHHRLDGAS